MATLPCPDGVGSINNPEAPEQVPDNTPYVPVAPCVGEWELGGDDECAVNENQNQSGYAAENININGAPLRIYRLLGVHEQGDGSLLAKGRIFASQAEPGFPVSNINNGGVWHSFEVGAAVTAVAYVGLDFGINTIGSSDASEYKPIKPNMQKVGCVTIQQGNTAFNFARQLRVDIADGAVVPGSVSFNGMGSGTLTPTVGPDAEEGTIMVSFTSPTEYQVSYLRAGMITTLIGVGTTANPFRSVIVEFTVSGTFAAGDLFWFQIRYNWKRIGVFNVSQSGAPVVLNLQKEYLAKAVRVVPTLYTGTTNWEVLSLDVLDSPPTDINNLQDLFYNENRDRDYAKTPVVLKAQYTINDSITDLSKFGLNILDQYSFVVSYPVMVGLLGRPIVTGDIIEVTPELQYDHNLRPVRKYVEVTDTGWASSGYSTTWKPSLYRFQAQQALPSQETRDIFGTMDTQKYLTADSFLADLGNEQGGQLDTTPITQTEELIKAAKKAVPEVGDDMGVSVAGVPEQQALPPVNPKGQPTPVNNFKQNIYIEDGIPPDGQPYAEGFDLPEVTGANDGDWFRLYYPESTGIAPRLYRFSALKNRWIFMEQDKRVDANSARPSISKILKSNTKQGLGKKTI